LGGADPASPFLHYLDGDRIRYGIISAGPYRAAGPGELHAGCHDLGADRSCRDGIAKRERRRNGGNGLRALADALNGDVAIVHEAAKNTLVDVDALDLVEAHLEGPPLDKTGLVNDPHIGDVSSVVQRWNQAVAVQ